MEQELLINKLIFNLERYHIDLRQALTYAYGAGFDEKNKINGSEKPIEYTDKEGRKKVFQVYHVQAGN